MASQLMTEKPLIAITGASSGIGAACARAFANAGYPTLLIARRRDRLEALGLQGAVIEGVDVRDVDAARTAITAAEAIHGPVDLLVNNAGLMPLGLVQNQAPAEWRSMLDVNVLALLELTQIVLPAMVARRHGTIMNVGSVAGRNIYGNHAVYCGTKFAVHAISEGLRREVAASNVRVSVIAPGLVETELLEQTSDPNIVTDYQAYKASVGGAMTPEAVADLMLHIYQLPQDVCIREIVLAPTAQDA
jgi:NADP-dependent 3-hydroxy acid dehydrogenase YdfG